MTVLFPLFQFACLFFPFLVWLLCLGLPILCWIKWWKWTTSFVSDLSGKYFSFRPLSMVLAVSLSYMAFIMWRNAPSIPTLLSVFIINECYSLSNAFSVSIYMIMWFLSLLLFMWCYFSFIDFWIVYHPCIPGMNPTWSWCMIFVMYCWMGFASILLRILASMFISNIGL